MHSLRVWPSWRGPPQHMRPDRRMPQTRACSPKSKEQLSGIRDDRGSMLEGQDAERTTEQAATCVASDPIPVFEHRDMGDSADADTAPELSQASGQGFPGDATAFDVFPIGATGMLARPPGALGKGALPWLYRALAERGYPRVRSSENTSTGSSRTTPYIYGKCDCDDPACSVPLIQQIAPTPPAHGRSQSCGGHVGHMRECSVATIGDEWPARNPNFDLCERAGFRNHPRT